jgi:hypothetical protein
MEIPPPSATNEYLSANNAKLDVTLTVDLGELVPGHHVVLRGIERGRTLPSRPGRSATVVANDQIHFEHVPGLTRDSPLPTWGCRSTDDVGSRYSEDEFGAYDGASGGEATHAVRDVGGRIPPNASLLTLEIRPAHEWSPRGFWIPRLTIHLNSLVR